MDTESVIDDALKEIEYWEQFAASWESDDTKEAGKLSGTSHPPMNLLLGTSWELFTKSWTLLLNPINTALRLFTQLKATVTQGLL